MRSEPSATVTPERRGHACSRSDSNYPIQFSDSVKNDKSLSCQTHHSHIFSIAYKLQANCKVKLACQNDLSHHYHFATLLQGSKKEASQKAGPKVQPQRFLTRIRTAKDQTADRQHWHASHCSNHVSLNSTAAALG